MALVTRLSRLFQADFHAVLDRIEEPDLQLRQAVREMQYALEQDRQRLQLLQHEAQQLQNTAAQNDSRLSCLDEELDLCLAAGQEDLARDLVRRKLVLEKQVQAATERHQQLDRQLHALDKQVEEQSQLLLDMQQKLELLVSCDDAPVSPAYTFDDRIRDEEIEIALLREKNRRAKS